MTDSNGNITTLKELYATVGEMRTRLEVLASRFESHAIDNASDLADLSREVSDLKKSMIPIQYQQESKKTGLQFWAAIIVAVLSASATIAVAVLR